MPEYGYYVGKRVKGGHMMQYKIQLTNETAVFYEKIACQTGRDAEQVLSDALFKLAGELALEALHKKR